jgi:hypothetical protein
MSTPPDSNGGRKRAGAPAGGGGAGGGKRQRGAAPVDEADVDEAVRTAVNAAFEGPCEEDGLGKMVKPKAVLELVDVDVDRSVAPLKSVGSDTNKLL